MEEGGEHSSVFINIITVIIKKDEEGREGRSTKKANERANQRVRHPSLGNLNLFWGSSLLAGLTGGRNFHRALTSVRGMNGGERREEK